MRVRGKLVCIMLLAGAAVVVLSGCATSTATANQGQRASRAGVPSNKPASSVAPCCRDMAAGRISLDQCMRKPECRANDNRCCMNAI